MATIAEATPSKNTVMSSSKSIPMVTPTDDKIKSVCKNFIMTDEKLKNVMDKLMEAIKKGLGKDTQKDSSVKCWPTYVQDLPTGKERGKFLGIDLGGTNLRVLVVSLDNKYFHMKSKVYDIPEKIMTGPGTELFDLIAECLASLMYENGLIKEKLPVGFTFSFPLEQVGLNKGILKTWTKGFTCSGVVGQDVVQMLEEAIKRRGDLDVTICGILNDTTGTQISCAWHHPNCYIGLIVGTGSNACYTEKIENVELATEDKSKPWMIINTESGAFGEKGELDSIMTEFDKEMDKSTPNCGKQLYEKMISGMYLGELVRLVIMKLTNDKVLFNGNTSEALKTTWSLKSKYVSDIERDNKGEFKSCRAILTKLGIKDASDQDCTNVRYVCECVSRRAAHLVSAGIATLLNKMNMPEVTIGVDGSIVRFHPTFSDLMIEKITHLADKNIKFKLEFAEDGGGRGACLLAAVACRARYGPDWSNWSREEDKKKRER